jgi:hypothetical protein
VDLVEDDGGAIDLDVVAGVDRGVKAATVRWNEFVDEVDRPCERLSTTQWWSSCCAHRRAARRWPELPQADNGMATAIVSSVVVSVSAFM